MLLSVGTVSVLFFWCLYKVFAHNPAARNVTEASMQDREDRGR